jgi:hypothetical protein
MPPVEAEDELVEVSAEMIGLNGTLVGAEEPTFGERCYAVHARQHQRCVRTGHDVMLVGVDPFRRHLVSRPTVGDHGRTLDDVVNEEGPRTRQVSEPSDSAPTPAAHCVQRLLQPRTSCAPDSGLR